jgi:hypothetical protein
MRAVIPSDVTRAALVRNSDGISPPSPLLPLGSVRPFLSLRPVRPFLPRDGQGLCPLALEGGPLAFSRVEQPSQCQGPHQQQKAARKYQDCR